MELSLNVSIVWTFYKYLLFTVKMPPFCPRGMCLFSNSCYVAYYCHREVKVLVTQSCLTLQPHGLQPTRLLCPWDSPGKNTGEGSHSLLQGIFLAQESNRGLLHCRQILYYLSHQGNSAIILLNRYQLCFSPLYSITNYLKYYTIYNSEICKPVQLSTN